MTDEDIDLIAIRSQEVAKILSAHQTKLGQKSILFEPATYDGKGGALVRPFEPVNLVGHPNKNKPVVFKDFKICDALLVNCSVKNNAACRVSTGDVKSAALLLRHNLRIFNVVLIENKLMNCSIISFDDFVSAIHTQEVRVASQVDTSSVLGFLKTYLSNIRKFGTLLPSHRKYVLPEYVQNRFKISVNICNDGIAIWFRRPINRKKDQIKVSRLKFLGDVMPKLSASENIFPLNGQKGVAISRLAIVTQGFANSVYKVTGTVLKIPDGRGILEVKSGADIKLENVLLGYLDKSEKPKQIVLKELWVFARDEPSLFTVSEGIGRAQRSIFNYLLRSAPIKGEKMKRYSEADMAQEIDYIEKEYTSLIARENAEEPELQKFLANHPFILSPTYLEICHGSLSVTPQARVSEGKRIVDFLLLFEPDIKEISRLATVVEIKRPSHPLFTKKGKLSKPLKEGLQQIDDIFEIFKEKPHEKKTLSIHDSDVIRGIVIIGRRSDLKEEELVLLEQIGKERPKTRIVTFDSLLENVDVVKDFYGVKGREKVVVVGPEGTSDEDFTGKNGNTIQRAIDYLDKRAFT